MPRGLKPFTTPKVRRVGTALEHVAKKVNHFASTLEEREFDGVLMVDAGDTMKKGLKFILKWLNKLKEAADLDELDMDFGDDLDAEIAAIANNGEAAPQAVPATDSPETKSSKKKPNP